MSSRFIGNLPSARRRPMFPLHFPACEAGMLRGTSSGQPTWKRWRSIGWEMNWSCVTYTWMYMYTCLDRYVHVCLHYIGIYRHVHAQIIMYQHCEYNVQTSCMRGSKWTYACVYIYINTSACTCACICRYTHAYIHHILWYTLILGEDHLRVHSSCGMAHPIVFTPASRKKHIYIRNIYIYIIYAHMCKWKHILNAADTIMLGVKVAWLLFFHTPRGLHP